MKVNFDDFILHGMKDIFSEKEFFYNSLCQCVILASYELYKPISSESVKISIEKNQLYFLIEIFNKCRHHDL